MNDYLLSMKSCLRTTASSVLICLEKVLWRLTLFLGKSLILATIVSLASTLCFCSLCSPFSKIFNVQYLLYWYLILKLELWCNFHTCSFYQQNQFSWNIHSTKDTPTIFNSSFIRQHCFAKCNFKKLPQQENLMFHLCDTNIQLVMKQITSAHFSPSFSAYLWIKFVVFF